MRRTTKGLIIGVACVGAPIRNKAGVVVAAISLTGSKARMEERVEEIVREVRKQRPCKSLLPWDIGWTCKYGG